MGCQWCIKVTVSMRHLIFLVPTTGILVESSRQSRLVLVFGGAVREWMKKWMSHAWHISSLLAVIFEFFYFRRGTRLTVNCKQQPAYRIPVHLWSSLLFLVFSIKPYIVDKKDTTTSSTFLAYQSHSSKTNLRYFWLNFPTVQFSKHGDW